jgi:hypothetical protein
MASKKYPVEKETLGKIKTLFEYRRLTDLLTITGLNKNKTFVGNLIDVQYQIYMLDSYLESQWALDNEEIKKLWTGITGALQKMDLTHKEIKDLTEEIREYQRIEKNCRKQKWPTRESMESFYTTKSCDVRLIRHLIYRAHPEAGKIWKEKAWKYFDIITEINDDVADVSEDINTFNGNRYLIAMLRKGSTKTVKQYMRYLATITEEAASYFETRMERGQNSQLASWTGERSKATALLLSDVNHTQLNNELGSSQVLAKMK